jgi:hypothetical protein
MITSAGLSDLRNYIQRRIGYAKYLVGSSYSKAELSKVEVLATGTVRAQLVIPGNNSSFTVSRVELYSNAGELWTYTDCNIKFSASQTGILYWFDFTITEG